MVAAEGEGSSAGVPTAVFRFNGPRAAFRLLHISGAVNIPLDEIEIRLPVEFSSEQRLLFFCGSPDDSSDEVSNCLTNLNILRRDDIQVIPHSLEDLEKGGIKMSRE
jgi:hypothetical protein